MTDDDNPTREVRISAQEAYSKYHDDGLTQTQIAEEAGVSQPYVSRLINGYKEGRETGREEVQENPGEFIGNFDELTNDEETEDRHTSQCPKCGASIPTPASPGQEPCSECGAVLKWSEDEL